jgi:hypothetical protein
MNCRGLPLNYSEVRRSRGAECVGLERGETRFEAGEPMRNDMS